MNERDLQPLLSRLRIGSVLAGVVGGVASAVSFTVDAPRFLESYLLAYLFWWIVCLGCLGVLMIFYLTGGRWGLAMRPLLECGALSLPLAALAFLPIAFELPELYPWAREQHLAMASANAGSAAGPAPIKQANVGDAAPIAPDVLRWYLNPPATRARAIGYFVVWLLLAYLLCRQTSAGPIRPRAKRRAAAAGLPLLVLTCTFATIDWAMSLDPGWYSTIYGSLFAVCGTSSAFALVTALVAAFQDRSHSRKTFVNPQTLADLGTLTQAFLMLWAYFAFSQFLIIWSGNLPEESIWYVRRLTAGWQWFGLASAGLGFAVPFSLLLSRDLKHHPRRLCGVAALVFVMQFVSLAWTILPTFRPAVDQLRAADLAAPLALGGIGLAWFCTLLPRRLRATHALTQGSS